jgi:aspartate/methionine/tyrosine aminotransferase
MTRPLHPRVSSLETESAFKVLARATELEKSGKEIVHLEIGQPDFPTPPNICEAAIRALRDGKTGYGPAAGLPELREAIAEHAGRRRGTTFKPEQVIVTPGAKPIILYTIQSLVGPGDEVIYPDPGFPMYASLIRHSGALPVALPLREKTGFRFDADEFREKLTQRTRLIIINSPQNPTGGVLTDEDLRVLTEEANRRDLMVLADEIYINFLYDGFFKSIVAFPGMAERTVVLDGFSKSYSMTGWRVGYGIVPPRLREAFELFNVNIVSCTATFSQYGALEAIRGPQESVQAMVSEFRRRRDFLVKALNGIPVLRSLLPGGAFYAFPNITLTGRSSTDLASDLLEKLGIALLSGNSFGGEGEGYLRLSYANSMENLEKAVERLRSFFR